MLFFKTPRIELQDMVSEKNYFHLQVKASTLQESCQITLGGKLSLFVTGYSHTGYMLRLFQCYFEQFYAN